MRKVFAIVALMSGALANCASFTPEQVAKPSDISLDTALNNVADSLHRLQDKYANKKKIGMMVDEVQVQFDIAVAASNGGQAQLNVAQVPLGAAGGTLGASAQHQESANANRGNTITVTFRNIATADLSKGSLSLIKPAGKGGANSAATFSAGQRKEIENIIKNLPEFEIQQQKGSN